MAEVTFQEKKVKTVVEQEERFILALTRAEAELFHSVAGKSHLHSGGSAKTGMGDIYHDLGRLLKMPWAKYDLEVLPHGTLLFVDKKERGKKDDW